jgi:hypothetical protein
MSEDIGKSAPLDAGDATSIEEALDKLFPRSLDDIVRVNRDRYQLGIATPDEFAALVGNVEPGRVKATLDQWRIVAFRNIASDLAPGRDRVFDEVSLSLLGRDAERRGLWMTSQVRRIDQSSGLVLTRNSIYRLGFPGAGEPPSDHLIHVAAMTHVWGVGDLIGAPMFFY